LNRREVQESIGFDQFVGQFKPYNPKGVSGSIIIIEIGIGIDEGSLHEGMIKD
jgi:hypothetical protein